MSNATDYLETALGNALFLGGNFPAITQWTVHLYKSLPTDAGTGALEVDIGPNGYQPVRHDPNPTNWVKGVNQDASNNTVFRNALPVQFPVALGDWGTINSFGLKDQNGNLCFAARLTTPQLVNAGHRPLFLAGELEFLIG